MMTEKLAPMLRETRFRIDTIMMAMTAVILNVHSGTIATGSAVKAWYTTRLTYSPKMSAMIALPPGLRVEAAEKV